MGFTLNTTSRNRDVQATREFMTFYNSTRSYISINREIKKEIHTNSCKWAQLKIFLLLPHCECRRCAANYVRKKAISCHTKKNCMDFIILPKSDIINTFFVATYFRCTYRFLCSTRRTKWKFWTLCTIKYKKTKKLLMNAYQFYFYPIKVCKVLKELKSKSSKCNKNWLKKTKRTQHFVAYAVFLSPFVNCVFTLTKFFSFFGFV